MPATSHPANSSPLFMVRPSSSTPSPSGKVRKWDCSPPRDPRHPRDRPRQLSGLLQPGVPQAEAFVPRFLRREIPERISYKGLSRPLDLSGLPLHPRRFPCSGVAVAICFLTVLQSSPRTGCARLGKAALAHVSQWLLTRSHENGASTSVPTQPSYPPMSSPSRHRYLDRLTGCLEECRMQCTPYHAVQLWCGHGQERPPDPDHDDRIDPPAGFGEPRHWAADRRAQRYRHRHRRHDGQMRADHQGRSRLIPTTWSTAPRPPPAIRSWCRW